MAEIVVVSPGKPVNVNVGLVYRIILGFFPCSGKAITFRGFLLLTSMVLHSEVNIEMWADELGQNFSIPKEGMSHLISESLVFVEHLASSPMSLPHKNKKVLELLREPQVEFS